MEREVKRPSDSAQEKVFAFGSDPSLREEYINSFGDLRFGKLLEEMDWTAGMTAYAHCGGITDALTIVTAACDRIELLSPLPSNQDLRLLSQVNYVGRSSMEIGIHIDSLSHEHWETVARAYFIMVARKQEKAYAVPKLAPETAEELRRFEDAVFRQRMIREQSGTNYLEVPPSEQEAALLHRLFLQNKQGRDQGVLMAETHRQATILMHPQNRNIHHKIFGGYIMRMSFETAWTIAHIFCRRRPLFICVDHFDFFQPVEIGSIVSFDGMVTFTGKTSFIVEVNAEVIHPVSGTRELTNLSYFTFVAVDENGKPTPVPPVIPHSYEQGLKYIDGHRRYNRVKNKDRKSG